VAGTSCQVDRPAAHGRNTRSWKPGPMLNAVTAGNPLTPSSPAFRGVQVTAYGLDLCGLSRTHRL